MATDLVNLAPPSGHTRNRRQRRSWLSSRKGTPSGLGTLALFSRFGGIAHQSYSLLARFCPQVLAAKNAEIHLAGRSKEKIERRGQPAPWRLWTRGTLPARSRAIVPSWPPPPLLSHRAADEIRALHPSAKVHCHVVDLAKLRRAPRRTEEPARQIGIPFPLIKANPAWLKATRRYVRALAFPPLAQLRQGLRRVLPREGEEARRSHQQRGGLDGTRGKDRAGLGHPARHEPLRHGVPHAASAPRGARGGARREDRVPLVCC